MSSGLDPQTLNKLILWDFIFSFFIILFPIFKGIL